MVSCGRKNTDFFYQRIKQWHSFKRNVAKEGMNINCGGRVTRMKTEDVNTT